ncbi:hypothetical protein D3D03_05225 [Exiguobacterium sp. RIT452]|nr:hypothetical protein D3D03_05225 [Exiguobacterium sp. RIT452]
MKKRKAGDFMQANHPTGEWQYLPQASVTAERQYVGIKYTIVALLIGVATVVQITWLDLSPWWMWIAAAVVGLLFILQFVYLPPIRKKYFKFRVDEEFLIVESGIFILHHVVTPLVKVQIIDTSSGPILRRHELMNMNVRTASGEIDLHGLEVTQAKKLRQQIERIAKLEEQEEETL